MTDAAPQTDDYAADIAPPSMGDLKALTSLARRAAEVQREKNRIEAELARAEAMHKDLVEREIPEMMQTLRMRTFSLDDGTSIEVSEHIRASIPKARHDEGIDWLDNNGEGGMVKRVITIAFNRDEQAWANKFIADMKKRKVQLRSKMERKVEPMTLKSWVAKKLEAGASIPEDLFGVFKQKIAKIVLPG